MTDRIRLFVGTSANQEDTEAEEVLEYTARSLSSVPIDITWMRLSRDSRSPFYCDPAAGEGWITERWGSPWTAFRWAVPALCGFEGRAIYADATLVLRSDLSELWETDLGGRVLSARWTGGQMRAGCILWDCGAARPHVPDLPDLQRDVGAHQRMLHYFAGRAALVRPFSADADWAVPDQELGGELEAPHVRGIHCSALRLQPHARWAVPRLRREGREHWFPDLRLQHYDRRLVALFDRLLGEAGQAGLGRRPCGERYGGYVLGRKGDPRNRRGAA